MFYTARKAAQIFSASLSSPWSEDDLVKMSEGGALPKLRRGRGGLGWDAHAICTVGERLGGLCPADRPRVMSLFVTKGGVLKTTLTLNLSRLFALHGLKTVVVGLDLQGDITTALGYQPANADLSLEEAMAAADRTSGLYDYFSGRLGLDDLLVPTDLENLQLIPETPELIALDQELWLRPRREFWLKEKVIAPLKNKFDVILLDCSPNWNQLITNALVTSDLLLSPVECRINNYRNLKLFRALISQCRRDLSLDFAHAFVPTRLNQTRRLSREIGDWYQANLPNCLTQPIRESLLGEEAMAMHLSVPEFAPDAPAGQEMLQFFHQVHRQLQIGRREDLKHQTEVNPEWPSA